MAISTKFLPLKKFHIVPITSISPEQIKKAAKNVRRDKEKIGHTTLLNAITNSLGFTGGFAGYQSEYKEKLLPFLKKHGLKKQTDLFEHQHKSFDVTIPSISPQKFANRIFQSKLTTPKSVFSGYNFDFKNTFDNHHYLFNIAECPAADTLGLIRRYKTTMSLQYLNPSDQKKNDLIHNLNIANANSHYKITYNENNKSHCNSEDSKKTHSTCHRFIKDYVLCSAIKDVWQDGMFDLLNDTLILPERAIPAEPKLYYPMDYKPTKFDTEAVEYSQFASTEIKKRLEETSKGWLQLIPYNKKLIFLKGENGQYDFIFSKMKDSIFKHEVHEGLIKISEIPSFNKEYHFNRWLYFEYNGWLELDEHNSEKHYYKTNSNKDYPGSAQILQTYLAHKAREIKHEKQITAYNTTLSKHFNTYQPKLGYSLLDNFFKVKLHDKTLAISNLITIEDIESMLSNEDLTLKNTFEWDCNNGSPGKKQAATVTWIHLLKYIHQFEQTNNIAVRPLSVDEYLYLRKVISKSHPELNASPSRKISFSKRRGTDIFSIQKNRNEKPSSDDFISIFNPRTPSVTTKDGLTFWLSDDLAEWVLDQRCIRSLSLTSYGADENLMRTQLPANIDTRYKNLKIGFRLCYEIHEE